VDVPRAEGFQLRAEVIDADEEHVRLRGEGGREESEEKGEGFHVMERKLDIGRLDNGEQGTRRSHGEAVEFAKRLILNT
jgi:hypothetical protein